MKAVIANRAGDALDDYNGRPIADVEVLLGVSKQRIHQLIEAGRLDAIEVTNAKGATAMILVTQNSLDKFAPQPTGLAFGQTARV